MTLKLTTHVFALLFTIAQCSPTVAEVRLPKVFGDHMVLQQEFPIAIWGWADPGEAATVSLADAKVSTSAGEQK